MKSMLEVIHESPIFQDAPDYIYRHAILRKFAYVKNTKDWAQSIRNGDIIKQYRRKFARE